MVVGGGEFIVGVFVGEAAEEERYLFRFFFFFLRTELLSSFNKKILHSANKQNARYAHALLQECGLMVLCTYFHLEIWQNMEVDQECSNLNIELVNHGKLLRWPLILVFCKWS